MFFTQMLGTQLTRALLGVVALSLIGPVVATAEAPTDFGAACPLNPFLATELHLTGDTEAIIDDTVDVTVRVENPTAYTLAGIQVGVVLFADGAASQPAYWLTAADTLALLPGEVTELPWRLDASAVAPGAYLLTPVVFQGTAVDILGAAVAGVGTGPGVMVEKATLADPTHVHEISIPGQALGETDILLDRVPEALTVIVETKNLTDAPLQGVDLVAVISKGAVSLGGARRAAVQNELRLPPQGVRVTELTDRFAEFGSYSIYTGLVAPDALQPVVMARVSLGETIESEQLPFIAGTGLADYPLGADTEIVACVRYTHAPDIDTFIEPLQLLSTLTTGDGQVAALQQSSEDTNTQDFFSFTPGVVTGEFALVSELQQQRFRAGGDEVVMPEDTLRYRTVYQTELDVPCLLEAGCDALTAPGDHPDVAETAVATPRTYPNPWLSAGVTLATALLLFLILQRMPPQKAAKPAAKKSPAKPKDTQE